MTIKLAILGSAWFEARTASDEEATRLSEAFNAVGIDPNARDIKWGTDFGKLVLREGDVTSFYTSLEKAMELREHGVSVVPSKQPIRMISQRQ